MLALRIHLAPCGPKNGPLRVLAGSHRDGWIKSTVADWKAQVPEVVCTVEEGGIVGICPLLLHASAKADTPARRRVIHIEYARRDLPAGLRWRWSRRPN
jgi:ectoine hydroxylase-related dioxygenase (phytanoyl-CoA dioxygenase family)